MEPGVYFSVLKFQKAAALSPKMSLATALASPLEKGNVKLRVLLHV